MSQSTLQSLPSSESERELSIGMRSDKLPGLPNRPLSPQEQLLALRRVQAQAEQRLNQGSQFFRAAQAQAIEHANLLAQLRQEQARLREQMREEYARSIREYDLNLQHRDDDVTGRLDQLENRLVDLQTHWSSTENKVAVMLQRAEAMLDQSRCLLHSGPKHPEKTKPPVYLTQAQEQIHLTGAALALDQTCTGADLSANLLPDKLNLNIDSGATITWKFSGDATSLRMAHDHKLRGSESAPVVKAQFASLLTAPTQPLTYSDLGQPNSSAKLSQVDEPPLSPSLFCDIIAKLRQRQNGHRA